MSLPQTSKSMGYDHPVYLARLVHQFPNLTAGSAATSSKFVAFTNMLVYSISAVLATSGGTSTYTNWNGTSTVTAIGAQTFSLVRIFNTATAGATPVLGTATYGPFVQSLYNGTATGTQTNSTASGLYNNVELFNSNLSTYSGTIIGGTNTGQIQVGANLGTGGVPIQQGDQLYIVQGTEATAVGAYSLEYGILPLAPVTN